MTLVEAINSGVPFKRPGWNSYMKVESGSNIKSLNGNSFMPRVSDISADDYVLKEQEILLKKGAVELVMSKLIAEEDYHLNDALIELGYGSAAVSLPIQSTPHDIPF